MLIKEDSILIYTQFNIEIIFNFSLFYLRLFLFYF